VLGRLHAAPTLQWRRNLLLRRLAGFGDRSHHACSLIGAKVSVPQSPARSSRSATLSWRRHCTMLVKPQVRAVRAVRSFELLH